MDAIEIRAPVRGETASGAPRWVHVVFAAGRDASEQIEIADDRLAFDGPPSRRLYELKQRFGGSADFRLSNDERAAFKQGCPRARIDDGGDPDVRVLLGLAEQCSWELAYVLACAAAAGVGRWGSDVRYVATGQLHDGRIRADLVADKLALARQHPGRLVFLAPFDQAQAPAPAPALAPGGARDPAERHSIVGISSLAELWEHAGSPLAAHADLDALAASIRRAFAPRARDIALTVRIAGPAQDTPLILCGGSGAGKTSVLGGLALDAASDPGRFGVDLALPPIALRRFAVRQAHGIEPLLDCIGEVLFEHGAYRQPPRPEQVRALLCSHRALILFDGLHEVADASRAGLATALDGLLTLCPNHRYVMTDGLSPWLHSARWRLGELLPMNDAQVQALLTSRPEPAALRLLARPDLRDVLRTPLLAVLLAESAEPSGGVGTLEQVIHGFVQDRFERWAGEHQLTRHSAAVVDLVDAARRIAAELGARAFTAEEAARVVARSAPWPHDPVSALIACGFLIDGSATGTLQFRHDTLWHYFHAGAIAARCRRGRLHVKRGTLMAPHSEAWLRYLAIQLAPEPAHRFILAAARESPALGARLADTLPDDDRIDPALTSIARSAKLMRGLSREWIGNFAIYVLVMLGLGGGLLLPQFALGVSVERSILLGVLATIALVWPWLRFTRVTGDAGDDAPFRRLLAMTLELRPTGRVHAALETIVHDTVRSFWASGAVRGYATVLSSGTRASPRDPLELLQDAAQRRALASGILALEHLADPRVAAILAHLIARHDLHSSTAVKATRARAGRFPHADFWLVLGADPRVLASEFQTGGNGWGFIDGLLLTLLTSWLIDPAGMLILCLVVTLVATFELVRAGARFALGADTWSGCSPWSYALGLLLPLAMPLALYLSRRAGILRSARGIDWENLAAKISPAGAAVQSAPAGPYRQAG